VDGHYSSLEVHPKVICVDDRTISIMTTVQCPDYFKESLIINREIKVEVLRPRIDSVVILLKNSTLAARVKDRRVKRSTSTEVCSIIALISRSWKASARAMPSKSFTRALSVNLIVISTVSCSLPYRTGYFSEFNYLTSEIIRPRVQITT